MQTKETSIGNHTFWKAQHYFSFSDSKSNLNNKECNKSYVSIRVSTCFLVALKFGNIFYDKYL